MMAAVSAAAGLKEAGEGGRVLLFEKNAYLGAKVIISGGGRCNVTTGIFDVKKLMLNYPRGAKFLMSAFYRFPPEKVMEWFEEQGVKLKIEEDKRVFPVSDDGHEIVAALERQLRKLDVEIFFKASVSSVLKEGKKFAVAAGAEKHSVDSVILTTGGNAYRHTGSTGDGYAFAKAAGHNVTALAPSLNSFMTAELFVKNLAGVSFEKVAVKFVGTAGGEKHEYVRTGPIVFTHYGISGPAVFALSSISAFENYSKEQPATLSINFFPDESAENLQMHSQKLADENGKKQLVNFLDIFLPKSLCGVFIERLNFPADLKAGQLSKEHRNAITALMQNFTLTAVGRGAGDEFVSAGGVDLAEVNTNTMESKICPGLYFAGEILDVDGFTGGFNLQASWATGKLAGENAAKQ